MFNRSRSLIAAPALALAAFGLAGHAHAASYTLGGGSSVDAHDSGDGLLIETQLFDLSGDSFNLNDGESHVFDFFTIWTDEPGIGDDDLDNPQPITAYLDFDTPDLTATIEGETDGSGGFDDFPFPFFLGDLNIDGIFADGAVTWDGPVLIEQDGYRFTVSLNDATFNSGVLSVYMPGEAYGATIQATVTQLPSQVVPTPSAAAAGMMLAGLGLLRRRRRMA